MKIRAEKTTKETVHTYIANDYKKKEEKKKKYSREINKKMEKIYITKKSTLARISEKEQVEWDF